MNALPDRAPSAGGELLSHPLFGLYQRCMGYVHAHLDQVADQLAAGYMTDAEDDIATVVSDMVDLAAQDGNLAQAETYLALMDQLSDAQPEERSRAYAIASACGSQLATNYLHSRLAIEKQEITAGEDLYTGVWLSNVVGASRRSNASPAKWIEQYAVSPKENWHLWFDHLLQNVKNEQPQSSQAKQEFEAKVSELLSDTTLFDENFMVHIMPKVLEEVEDPQLCQQLLQRFMKCVQTCMREQIVEDEFGFEHDVIEVGLTVLRNPHLAAPEIVRWFVQALEAIEILGEEELFAYSITLRDYHRLEWKTALQKFSGASPYDIVASIDKLAQTHLSHTDDLSGESQLHDYALSGLAIEYLAENDLAAASLMWRRMWTATQQENLLFNLMQHPQNEEIQALIMPDAIWLNVHPELERQFLIAGALRSQDWPKLRNLALECATYNTPGSIHIKGRWLLAIYKAFAANNPGTAPALAADLLEEMRSVESSSVAMVQLSETLIDNGDVAEAENMYDYSRSTERAALGSVWQLSAIIKRCLLREGFNF